MMTKRLVMLALGAVWMALGGSPAQAVQGKCLAGKSKCVVTLTSGLLKCHQTAETPGKTPDPNAKGCVDKVVTKFDGGATPEKGCFAKLEGKTGNDCLTFADTEVLQAAVQACVDQFVSAVDPPPLDQSKCGAGKKKCVAIQAKGLLSCYRKAQTPGKPEDPNDKGCLDKVAVKFDGGIEPAKGCFAKLEAKTGNDCLPPLGNTAAVRGLVESCLASVLAQLEGGVTTTTAPTDDHDDRADDDTTTADDHDDRTADDHDDHDHDHHDCRGPSRAAPSNTLDVTATLVYEPAHHRRRLRHVPGGGLPDGNREHPGLGNGVDGAGAVHQPASGRNYRFGAVGHRQQRGYGRRSGPHTGDGQHDRRRFRARRSSASGSTARRGLSCSRRSSPAGRQRRWTRRASPSHLRQRR